MKVAYTIPSTKKTIEFEIKNEIKNIIIYGNNGTGKTTISRALEKAEGTKVFNVDYINKNVYIVGNSGPEINPTNKENFSNIFLGPEAVKINEKIEALQKYTAQFEKIPFDIFAIIKEQIPTSELSEKMIEDKICNSFEIDNLEITWKNRDPNIGGKIFTKPGIDIIRKSEFDAKKSEISKNENLDAMLKEISDSPLLGSICSKGKISNEITKKIEKYNSKINDLKTVEEILKSTNKDEREWIKKGYWIHKNKKHTKCLFCKSDNIQNEFEKYKKIFEDEFKKNKEELKQIFDTGEEQCEKIVDQTLYSSFFDYLKLIKNVKKNIIETKKNIDKNELIHTEKYIFPDFSDGEKRENKKKIDDIIIYLLNINKNGILNSKKIEKIKKEISKLKNEAKIAMEKTSNETVKKINEYTSLLHCDIKIVVRPENRTKITKISLDKNAVKTASEGQKNIIALAIFLAEISMCETKLKAIVFDDPVATLDALGYHYFKNIIIKLKKEKYEDTMFFILSHDLSYLQVQTSNIHNNEKLLKQTMFFALSKKNIKKYDLEILKTDDIVLLKNFLLELGKKNQDTKEIVEIFSYGYWLLLKIMRLILDLKTRTTIGYTSLKNPAKEFEELIKFSENKEKDFEKARKIYKNVQDIIKSNKVELKKIETIKKFIEFSKIMDFGEIVNQNDEKNILVNLKKIKNSALISKNKYRGENITIKILEIGKTISNSDNKDELREYISHPRNNVTQPLFQVFIDRDEE